jgi:hypothetical protein
MYTLVPGKKLLVYHNTLKVIDDEAYLEGNEESDADADADAISKERKVKSEHLNDICDIEVVGYE